MTRSILLIVLIGFTSFARADEVTPPAMPRAHRKHVVAKAPEAKAVKARQPLGILLSAGDMAIWQKASDSRSYDIIQRYAFRAGYSFHGLLDIYGEYGFYNANSDSGGNVTIHYHHDEYLVWARKMFLEDKGWGPYAAIGFGAQQESVKTTLGDSSVKNTGTLQALGALAGGIRFGTWVQVLIEGRLSVAAGLNPNPEPGVGVYVGTRF